MVFQYVLATVFFSTTLTRW